MRKIAVSISLAVAALVAVPALAGDCMSGFTCENVCPLAKKANECRSAGTEALATSASLRTVVAAQVARNLQRV